MNATDYGPAVPRFIGIDWGSSRLRAHAVTRDGDVLDSLGNDAGVLVTPRRELENVLSEALAGWQKRWPDCSIFASGMIGSRSGLTEVPYVDTPAGLDDIRRGIRQVRVGTGLTVNVIPGVRQRNERGIDVMRGEETALMGWRSRNRDDGQQLLVLPGTHCKWARLSDDKITDFCTFSTGELYDVLLHSPSLRDLDPGNTRDVDAFRRGLNVGLTACGLFHDYFAIRAKAVSGSTEGRSIQDELSGILIGYEIAEARNRSILRANDAVTVIGQGQLALRYVDALEHAHISATFAENDYLVDGWLTLCRDPLSGLERLPK